MKIIQTTLLIVILFLASACEKVSFSDEKHADKEEKSDDKEKDNGNVNDKDKACTIDVTVAPFTLTRGEAYIPTNDKILYALFDSLGRRCWMTEQTLGESDNYGCLTATMNAGRYSLLTIGHHTKDIDVCTLDSVTFADGIPFDTYSKVTDFTISNGEKKKLSVSLENVTAKIEIRLLNGKPKDLRSVSVTSDRCNVAFCPLSGFAKGDYAKRDYFAHDLFTQENNFTVSSFRFLTSDQETTNIDVALMDIYGELIKTYTFENVLLRRGEKTTLELQ